IEDAADVESIADGIPVLASIPTVLAGRQRLGFLRLGRQSRVGGRREIPGTAGVLVTEMDSRSPVSESYRMLRTNILFSQVDEPLRTIVVTSPGPGEGKSTVVANLGTVMAQAGNRTIIVDSDLRRPTVSAVLGGSKGVGLSDVLSGKKALKEVVTPTMVERLFLLGTGTLPPNPSEMLGSRRMRELVTELAQEFEFVLFDSPPVLPISDAAALGARVDGTLLVVRCDVTAASGLSRALVVMKAVHAKVIGVVLNDLDVRRGLSDRYYDYYRSHSRAGEAGESEV
ncbi:MAG: CpsD/CapB family tyrosine-protein kinase, partial [Candidatus Eiseniibacteriota bacterium]